MFGGSLLDNFLPQLIVISIHDGHVCNGNSTHVYAYLQKNKKYGQVVNMMITAIQSSALS